ncbi:DUF1592 domain-containing protein [Telmatocola sphagniphila]|uniref:DUF1592 domain-containing protein n=1 Tax=Telmatocola sphagniphila TaxID=1123043 RepID=A0A8E6BA98_9BACT|nr:DUF1592 domain-containing protein [Telmatocola sphagniphila]QVL34149.1 DUF1592 domain-containing protein [Telmatocola sphagniphila]
MPFLQSYCVKCHNPKTSEGELDLTKYTSTASIAQDFRQWEHVISFLKDEKMPPKEAKQPETAERKEFLAALEKGLLLEAKKLAEDPGVSLPRRLSNAEYNYTIRDLTGVDIRPTASFPIDPASGEGFNNTGEALVMSPNLFKKYYAAAQQVADHLLLTTTGFEFAPYPVITFADQQKFYEQAILRFYDQHKIQYETYLASAWSYRYRPASRRDVSIETWATEHKLSAKYLASLWNLLQDDTSNNVFYIQWLRQTWNALPAPVSEKETAIPPETLRQIRSIASTIQKLSKQLCTVETQAIISDGGNAPIVHIDRRKKMAAGRDKFNREVLQKPAQQLHWELKKSSDKSPSKLIISISGEPSDQGDQYVLLNRLNFSSAGEPDYNSQDLKRNLSLRNFLVKYAPDQLKTMEFGVHPLGNKVDAGSLILKVPSVIEIGIPPEALKDPLIKNFYAEASLNAKDSQSGFARVSLSNQKNPREDVTCGVFLIARDHPAAKAFQKSCETFCQLFPNRFYYVDETRGLSAGFHLIEGFFRDDQPLYNSVLSETEKKSLDRFWDELYFATKITEKMLHGFVFFEREERGFLKHPDFKSFKEEDPDLGKEDNLLRFEQVYLKRSNVKVTGEELEKHPIHAFFEDIRQGLRRRDKQLKEAEAAYIRNLQNFAKAAYRRPLSEQENKELVEFYTSVARQAEFGIEQAVRASITRILVSPHFCYRLELPPAGKTIQPVSDLILASRLSYFLWSSMPDKELLDLASKGELNNEKVLKAQVRRMLKDPKVSGFAQEFFGQWLKYRDFLQSETVNRQLFPEFDDSLKQAMFEEPTRFATGLIQEDLSLLNLLNGDFTYVNKRLARHYGFPFPGEEAVWIKISGLTAKGRSGFLGMAVFLTKNSQPGRTSPVKRGYWTVHELMGEHIPPPPPNVAVLPAKETDTQGKSIRELMALHTENVMCARCHQHFDPIGLAMEGFDPIGKHRTKDLAGRQVDNLVHLPSGEVSQGIPEFARYLATNRKNEFTQTLCRKFLGFGLGRSLELSDKVLLEKLQAQLEENDYRFSALFESVVLSPQFRSQRGKDYQPTVLKIHPAGEKP